MAFNKNTPEYVKIHWYRQQGNESRAKDILSNVIDEERRAIKKVKEWVEIPLAVYDSVINKCKNSIERVNTTPERDEIIGSSEKAIQFKILGWVPISAFAWKYYNEYNKKTYYYTWTEGSSQSSIACVAKWLYDKKIEEKK